MEGNARTWFTPKQKAEPAAFGLFMKRPKPSIVGEAH
jgi:hypothetical protein